jgi:hypothetical protein
MPDCAVEVVGVKSYQGGNGRRGSAPHAKAIGWRRVSVRYPVMRRAAMAFGRSTFAAVAVAVIALWCGAAWVRSFFAAVSLRVAR